MDFEYQETEAAKQFQTEVRNWLISHIPQSISEQSTVHNLDTEISTYTENVRKELGDQGWLSPTLQEQVGGANLQPDQLRILRSELENFGLRWLEEDSAPIVSWALMNGGTKEQKLKYLQDVAVGSVNVWYNLIVTGAPQDPNAISISATSDGDDFILDGHARFVKAQEPTDYFWTLALIESNITSELAVTAFLVPAHIQGITIKNQSGLTADMGRQVQFDQVRVSGFNLVGSKGEGWSLLQAALQANKWPPQTPNTEHVSDLIEYAHKTIRDGTSVAEEPVLQQMLVDAFLDCSVARVLSVRNRWMTETGQPLTYENAQVSLLAKRASLKLARIVRDVMGAYALLDEGDPRAPWNGKFEFQQRQSITVQNPMAGPDLHTGIIAKEIGITRDPESENRE
jgi:alkylation response protein AidB-like acyl-CoA dehydrogenase